MVSITKRFPAPKQDSITLREIELELVNDGDLYRQQLHPIITNLAKKKAKGIYNRALATKLVVYAVETFLKKFKRENGYIGTFSLSDKRTIATKVLSHITEQIDYEADELKAKAKPKKKPAKKKESYIGELKW